LKSFFPLFFFFLGLLGPGGFATKNYASSTFLGEVPPKNDTAKYLRLTFASTLGPKSDNNVIAAAVEDERKQSGNFGLNFRQRYKQFIDYHDNIIRTLREFSDPENAVDSLSRITFSPYYFQYILKNEILKNKSDALAVVFAFLRVGCFGGVEKPSNDAQAATFSQAYFSNNEKLFTKDNMKAICKACRHYQSKLTTEQITSLVGPGKTPPGAVQPPPPGGVGQQGQGAGEKQTPAGRKWPQPSVRINSEEIKRRLSYLPDNLETGGRTTKLLDQNKHETKVPKGKYKPLFEPITEGEGELDFQKIRSASPNLVKAIIFEIEECLDKSTQLSQAEKFTVLAYANGFLNTEDARFMIPC
jgi:hypothetical protein